MLVHGLGLARRYAVGDPWVREARLGDAGLVDAAAEAELRPRALRGGRNDLSFT